MQRLLRDPDEPFADAGHPRPRLPRRLALLANPLAAASSHHTIRGVEKERFAGKPRHLTANERRAVRKNIWKGHVKEWMHAHNCGADWELPQAEEKVLFNWFDAIDIDRSGTVDAEEIKALLAANMQGCSPARLQALFAMVGKQPHEALTSHDFVKLMSLGGASALFLHRLVPHEEEAEGGGTGMPASMQESTTSFAGSVLAPNSALTGAAGKAAVQDSRSCGDLAVMAYRRQRVLADLRDPTKRKAFVSREAFLRKYEPNAVKAYLKKWDAAGLKGPPDPSQVELTDAEALLAADGGFLKQHVLDVKEEEEDAERLMSSLPAGGGLFMPGASAPNLKHQWKAAKVTTVDQSPSLKMARVVKLAQHSAEARRGDHRRGSTKGGGSSGALQQQPGAKAAAATHGASKRRPSVRHGGRRSPPPQLSPGRRSPGRHSPVPMLSPTSGRHSPTARALHASASAGALGVGAGRVSPTQQRGGATAVSVHANARRHLGLSNVDLYVQRPSAQNIATRVTSSGALRSSASLPHIHRAKGKPVSHHTLAAVRPPEVDLDEWLQS